LVPVQLGMCISRMVTGSFSGLNIVVSLGPALCPALMKMVKDFLAHRRVS
jgi:hypothetical protein